MSPSLQAYVPPVPPGGKAAAGRPPSSTYRQDEHDNERRKKEILDSSSTIPHCLCPPALLGNRSQKIQTQMRAQIRDPDLDPAESPSPRKESLSWRDEVRGEGRVLLDCTTQSMRMGSSSFQDPAFLSLRSESELRLDWSVTQKV